MGSTLATSIKDKVSSISIPRGSLPEQAINLVKAEGSAPLKSSSAQFKAWLFDSQEGKEFELGDLETVLRDKKTLVWIDISSYSKQDLEAIAEKLSLHKVAIDATMASWQRPRIDSFKDHFYLSVTLPKIDKDSLEIDVQELDLFMGENFFLSVHKEPLMFLDSILSRVQGSGELLRMHSAFLLYIVLDEMLDYYESLFEMLEERIEKVEERALRDDSDQFLSNLLALKRYVFLMGRLAEQHRSIFMAFTRPDFEHISGEEVEPYFKDLLNRLSMVVERLLSARESVNGAFDIYVSQITHRTNQVMKLLAVVSTLMLPSSLVVSFFSTNFRLEIFHSLQGFYIMLVFMFLVPGVILYLLRKKRYI